MFLFPCKVLCSASDLCAPPRYTQIFPGNFSHGGQCRRYTLLRCLAHCSRLRGLVNGLLCGNCYGVAFPFAIGILRIFQETSDEGVISAASSVGCASDVVLFRGGIKHWYSNFTKVSRRKGAFDGSGDGLGPSCRLPLGCFV